MKLRFRLLAALLALVGLPGFTAGGAWAASCASQMEAETLPAENAVEPGAQCLTTAGLSQADESRQGSGSDSGAPHCPYMPMGAAGACGAALALPAESSPEFELSIPEARLSLPPDDVRELLLAAHFFRPPIA
jgi:hypothetical protein